MGFSYWGEACPLTERGWTLPGCFRRAYANDDLTRATWPWTAGLRFRAFPMFARAGPAVAACAPRADFLGWGPGGLDRMGFGFRWLLRHLFACYSDSIGHLLPSRRADCVLTTGLGLRPTPHATWWVFRSGFWIDPSALY